MSQQQPKFSTDFFTNWQHLINDVFAADKDSIREIPIEYLSEIRVTHTDDTVCIFDVVSLLSQARDPYVVEEKIQNYLHQAEEYVAAVDFHVNLKALADEVMSKVKDILP